MANGTQTVKPISRANGLRDNVASQIIQSIFRGTLKEGDRLIVQKLAQSLEVSATPVREALVQLIELGLVQQIPNRGAVCSAFGPKELNEFFQLRRILEVEAIRSVAKNPRVVELQVLADRTLSALSQKIEGKCLCAEVAALDAEFHDYIAVNCGSERLTHELKRYGMLMHEIRVFIDTPGDQQDKAMEEHLVMLKAILARDADAAAEGMSVHIDSACEVVSEIMFASKGS